MTVPTFKLTDGNEFIPLDKLLKTLRWVNSGGEAHRLIEQGLVTVNGEVELQKRKKLRPGDVAQLNNQQIIIQS